MAYPHKWSPISYKSSAGQRKHIGISAKDQCSTAGPHNQPWGMMEPGGEHWLVRMEWRPAGRYVCLC